MKKTTLYLTLLIPIAIGIGLTPIVANGQNINTAAGDHAQGYTGDNGLALSAELNNPTQVAVDAIGNLYFTDFANSRIREVNTAGIIFTVAGNGKTGYVGDGGPATNAELNNPGGIAIDKSGNVYIADADNDVVRMVNTQGNINTFAGTGTSGFSGDGSAATSAKLSAPNAVAVDGLGNVYISDAGNDRIRMVSSSGNISTVAGNGKFAYAGDNGPATSASIDYPYGIAIDGSNNLYIADYVNNRIRKVSGGTITTIAGNGTPGYTGDGAAATAAELNYPLAVAIGPDSSTVYLTDGADNVIRYIDTKGNIHTCAGNGSAGYTGDGGPATAAQMNYPYGIAVNSMGNLFIADEDNNVIRETGAVQGINELNAAINLTIYPTPASNTLNIVINNNQDQINEITIYNMLGEQVYNANTTHFPASINISNLNAGIYILRVQNAKGVLNKPFEVVR